jgi:protein dithiol oxidoreductase (disulfide-forming)
MRLATFIVTAALALTTPLAAAAQAGVEYATLSPTQPTESRGKIEVIVFFSYTCPHCFDLEPDLHVWAKKLPKNVVLKRQPAIFSDAWEPMARAYFALEAMKAVDRLHGDLFNAIHVEDKTLTDPEAFFNWGASKGLDRARLKDAYHSFATGTKVARAKQLQRAYKINGVPALAINGKYVTSGSMAGSLPKSLQVASELIRRESSARK